GLETKASRSRSSASELLLALLLRFLSNWARLAGFSTRFGWRSALTTMLYCFEIPARAVSAISSLN
ncbi:MAG: hypothetical protein JXB15_10755, partial [Anaerolineales bacterium]|nr:hypothetical protein [Anaerolineales bacterium]